MAGHRAGQGLLLVLAWLTLGVGVAHAATTTTVTYVYTNAQGTPLAEADAQGNIIARYSYRPYGTQQSGPTNQGPGYTGHVHDPATGLVYIQQRYYDPEVGRFISPDPVGPAPGNVFNFGRYTYANDNPIVNIDPDGRTCVSTESHTYKCTVDKNTGHFTKSEIKRINKAYTKAVNDLLSHPFRTATVTLKGVSFQVSAGDVANALIKSVVKTGRGHPHVRARTQGGYNPNTKPGQQSWLSFRNGSAVTTIMHNSLVKDRSGCHFCSDIDSDLEKTFGHEGIHETPQDSTMSVFTPSVFNSIHNAEYDRAGNYLLAPTNPFIQIYP